MFLLRFIGRALVRHKYQLGAQQADRFGTALYRAGGIADLAEVDRHFHAVAVGGDRRLHAVRFGLLALFLHQCALLHRVVDAVLRRIEVKRAVFAVNQQRAALGQRQHRFARADHRRNAQGTRHNRAVRAGAAAGCEDAGHFLLIQTRHHARHHVFHHQNIRLLRLGGGFRAAQQGHHFIAHIAQIGGTLGQQRVVQGFLLLRQRFDVAVPRSGRA